MTDKKLVFGEQERDEYKMDGIKCFEIDSNVEEKEIPTSGEEYLLKVMKERAKCDGIAKFNLKDSNIYIKPGFDMEVDTFKPGKLKPTIEWQNIQVADFSDLRMYVIRMAARKKALLPSIFEETYKDFIKDNEIQWRLVFDSTEPTLSHVVGLKNKVVEKGLAAILSILGKIKPGHSINRRTGLWLHALLTVARHPPITADDSVLLRDLSKRCAEIRSHINLNDENARDLATPLNIFICIIATYFEQKDLGDYELPITKVAQIYYDGHVSAKIQYE